MYKFTAKDERRFWSKVKLPDFIGIDECWEWTVSGDLKGYGCFRLNGRLVHAQRLAYEMAVGPIPDGLHVCHHCDHPGCCNPDHLFVGTAADNMQDKKRKGRCSHVGSPGSLNGQARLTEQQVLEICRLYATGKTTLRIISKMFDIADVTVEKIVYRKLWTHI